MNANTVKSVNRCTMHALTCPLITRLRPLALAGLVALGFSGALAPAQTSATDSAAAKQTVSALATSAQKELQTSIDQLNKLREQIAAEKLPVAQQLTTAEEQVSQLRKESDRINRMVDQGQLELVGLRSEIKARQDELTYIGNLLDEYARSFESKVNISELQPLGPAIDEAKQAGENTTLSLAEKCRRQTGFVAKSIGRLFDAIGGMKFTGMAVDLQGLVSNGEFAIIGPVALFRGQSTTAAGSAASASGMASTIAGLVVAQSGSTTPLIRPLEGALQAGLSDLVSKGEGLLPLDPSRGGALKKLVQRTNLIHIFEKGGPIMWPLLVASILALGTVLERVLFLMIQRFRRDAKALDRLFVAVSKGDHEGAIAIGKKSKFFVVRALGYALAHKETSLASALLYAQAQELKRYQRGIPVLDTVITLAPLLGLLGTVTGMMGSFSLIGGELSSPGAITGGIAEALIATAFGLGIAITSLLPFNFLNARVEEARHELESAATQLELLVQQEALNAAIRSRNNGMGFGSGKPSVELMPADDVVRGRQIQQQRSDLQQQIANLTSELEGLSSGERKGPEMAMSARAGAGSTAAKE
jgi:biopolymer transport protein ExbB